MNHDSALIPFKAVTALIQFTGHHHAVRCEPWCSPWAASGQIHNLLTVTAVLPDPVTVRGQQGIWRMDRPTEDACLTLLLQSVMNPPEAPDD